MHMRLGLVPLGLLAAFETPDWSRVTASGWYCMGFVATVPLVVAYLAWFRALKLVPASVAAATVLVSPVVGGSGVDAGAGGDVGAAADGGVGDDVGGSWVGG